MAEKAVLDQFLIEPMVIEARGITYTVPPVSAKIGKILMAIEARGRRQAELNEGADTVTELTEEQERLLATIPDNLELGILTLGEDVYRQMEEHLSQADIARCSVYGMYYWLYGKESAEGYMQIVFGDGFNGEGPKGSATSGRSKSGRSTASGSRTRTASTRTTAPHRKK